jgi:imidazolonepropionase-like amidohydrolase
MAFGSVPAGHLRSGEGGEGEGAARGGAPPESFVLRAGRVFTVSSGTLAPGSVWVRDGKIAAVGEVIEAPAGVPVIDLPGHVLIPGLIDAAAALTGERRDVQKSLSPEVLAIDGWDFFADRRDLLRGGVTTVYVTPGVSVSAALGGDGVAPGSGGPRSDDPRLVSGRGAVIKVAGKSARPLARIVRQASGVQVTLGDLPKRPPSIYDPPVDPSPDRPFEVIPTQLPQSRPGAFLALRRLFDEAAGFQESFDQAPAGVRLSWPTPEVAALLPLLARDDYLRVRANRARDILHMLALVKEYGYRMVLEGGREADLLAADLAADRVPVIFSGGFRPGFIPRADLTSETLEGRYSGETAARLIRAGVSVVVHSAEDEGTKDLLLQAASATRFGVDPELALRAITLSAAEVLGVADRMGSIEPGKDADLVVLAGDPFSPEGVPQAVYIEGELAHHEGPTDLVAPAAEAIASAGETSEAGEGREEAPPVAPVIVRCGRLFTGRREHPGGVVVVRGTKIEYAGPGALTAALARGVRVIDASRYTVVPGFIDCASSIGARAETLARQRAAGSGAAGGAGRSTYRLADAIDPRAPEIADLLRSGITTVILSPEPIPEPAAGIMGQLTAWKLSGGERRAVTVKDYAALLVGANLKEAELKKIKKHHDDWKAWEARSGEGGAGGDKDGRSGAPETKEGGGTGGEAAGGSGDPATDGAAGKDGKTDARDAAPEPNEAYEPFRALFEREAPAVVFATSSEALLAQMRRLKNDFGMRVVAAGPVRIDEIAPDLRRDGAAAIVSVPFVVRDAESFEELSIPSALAREGLPFAFASRAASGAGELAPQVAFAVRRGLAPRDALQALTVGAAEIFGIHDRVGSLEEGKDADLVFLSGEPFALSTRVAGVMVDGELRFLEEE